MKIKYFFVLILIVSVSSHGAVASQNDEQLKQLNLQYQFAQTVYEQALQKFKQNKVKKDVVEKCLEILNKYSDDILINRYKQLILRKNLHRSVLQGAMRNNNAYAALISVIIDCENKLNAILAIAKKSNIKLYFQIKDDIEQFDELSLEVL